MDPEEERIIRGVLFLLAGVLYNLYLFFMAWEVFELIEIISLSFIAMTFLATAFVLIGIFSIRPAKTHKGKMILGLTSMIFGGVIFLLPIIDIFVQISGIESPHQSFYLLTRLLSIILYLVAGATLLAHGIFMFRKNYTPGMLKRDS